MVKLRVKLGLLLLLGYGLISQRYSAVYTLPSAFYPCLHLIFLEILEVLISNC